MKGATLIRKTAVVAVLVALGWLSWVQSGKSAVDVVAQMFGADAWQARCIRSHESSGNRYAVSPTGDYGWFQINYRTWAGHVVSYYTRHRGVWIRLPRNPAAFRRVTFNTVRNTQLGWAISHGGTDWMPWSSYSVHGWCR